MNPVFMEIGSLTIHWYGVLFSAGFAAATVHWAWFSRRVGQSPMFGVELCVWVMSAGVVGARLAYVTAHWSTFAAQPSLIFRFDEGGLVFYGGLIGATLAGLVLAYRRHIPGWSMADYAISGVPLGHAIGRVGCFMQGCCQGAPSTSWWAIPIDGVLRHPVQIIETTFNLVVYILLVQLYRSKHREGRVFAAYLVLYPMGRFGFEFLRGDARLDGVVFNVAQELSVLMLLTGAVLWFALPRKRHHNHRRHAKV